MSLVLMSINPGNVGTPQMILSSRKGNIKSKPPPLPNAAFRKKRKQTVTTIVIIDFTSAENGLKNRKNKYKKQQGTRRNPVGRVNEIRSKNKMTPIRRPAVRVFNLKRKQLNKMVKL